VRKENKILTMKGWKMERGERNKRVKARERDEEREESKREVIKWKKSGGGWKR
jgi:hypothetical protein